VTLPPPCWARRTSPPAIRALRLGLATSGGELREYRELEAGARSPTFETWDRICKMFGWPQTFASRRQTRS